MIKKEMKKLKGEIVDELNAILIKLKDIDNHDVEFTYDGYAQTNDSENYDEEKDEYVPNPNAKSDEELYLSCLKNILERAVKGEGETLEHAEVKYYTSTC